MTKCHKCGRELKHLKGKYKFAVQLAEHSKEEEPRVYIEAAAKLTTEGIKKVCDIKEN